MAPKKGAALTSFWLPTIVSGAMIRPGESLNEAMWCQTPPSMQTRALTKREWLMHCKTDEMRRPVRALAMSLRGFLCDWRGDSVKMDSEREVSPVFINRQYSAASKRLSSWGLMIFK